MNKIKERLSRSLFNLKQVNYLNLVIKPIKRCSVYDEGAVFIKNCLIKNLFKLNFTYNVFES